MSTFASLDSNPTKNTPDSILFRTHKTEQMYGMFSKCKLPVFRMHIKCKFSHYIRINIKFYYIGKYVAERNFVTLFLTVFFILFFKHSEALRILPGTGLLTLWARAGQARRVRGVGWLTLNTYQYSTFYNKKTTRMKTDPRQSAHDLSSTAHNELKTHTF
jgi:hypothetical protein